MLRAVLHRSDPVTVGGVDLGGQVFKSDFCACRHRQKWRASVDEAENYFASVALAS